MLPKKKPTKKLFTAADIAKRLKRYFMAVDENLIIQIEKELIKISLVSVRKYPTAFS
jgi:hypothetical protein